MHFGMMGSLWALEPNSPEEGLAGTFYKFLNIDPNKPWLDQRERKPVDFKKEKKQLPVPEYLKPDLKEIPFLFYPKYHRLFFQKKITPSSMRRLLQGLCLKRDILNKFGEVDVIVETSQEAINRILAIPKKTKIVIFITRHNDDDLSGLTQEVLERIENQKIRKYKTELIGDKKEGIDPDDETIAAMHAAKSNGWVIAEGFAEDPKKKIVESTDPHPLTEKIFYYPDLQTIFDALQESAQKLLEKIKT